MAQHHKPGPTTFLADGVGGLGLETTVKAPSNQSLDRSVRFDRNATAIQGSLPRPSWNQTGEGEAKIVPGPRSQAALSRTNNLQEPGPAQTAIASIYRRNMKHELKKDDNQPSEATTGRHASFSTPGEPLKTNGTTSVEQATPQHRPSTESPAMWSTTNGPPERKEMNKIHDYFDEIKSFMAKLTNFPHTVHPSERGDETELERRGMGFLACSQLDKLEANGDSSIVNLLTAGHFVSEMFAGVRKLEVTRLHLIESSHAPTLTAPQDPNLLGKKAFSGDILHLFSGRDVQQTTSSRVPDGDRTFTTTSGIIFDSTHLFMNVGSVPDSNQGWRCIRLTTGRGNAYKRLKPSDRFNAFVLIEKGRQRPVDLASGILVLDVDSLGDKVVVCELGDIQAVYSKATDALPCGQLSREVRMLVFAMIKLQREQEDRAFVDDFFKTADEAEVKKFVAKVGTNSADHSPMTVTLALELQGIVQARLSSGCDSPLGERGALSGNNALGRPSRLPSYPQQYKGAREDNGREFPSHGFYGRANYNQSDAGIHHAAPGDTRQHRGQAIPGALKRTGSMDRDREQETRRRRGHEEQQVPGVERHHSSHIARAEPREATPT